MVELTELLWPWTVAGLQAPRSFSVLGNHLPLPSPRLVSRAVHKDVIGTSHLTLLVMQWGQFMDHEMVSTPLPIGQYGSSSCPFSFSPRFHRLWFPYVLHTGDQLRSCTEGGQWWMRHNQLRINEGKTRAVLFAAL